MKILEHRAELERKFQITSRNNLLVFSWKYPLSWYVIAIPPGDYTVEELNEQLNQRITDISSINSPLKLKEFPITSDSIKEFSLSDSITGDSLELQAVFTINVEITHPAVVIDIYQSSIRTVLGFPEHPNEDSLSFLTYGVYSVDNN